MALRYLGKGTTDEHGVAHLTTNASGSTVNPPGYVGQGIGELDVVASVDKPIVSGSVVSEPYTVIDATLYDVATSFDNTKWSNNGCTTSYGTDGTTLSYGTGYRYTSLGSAIDGCVIEFDLYIPSTATYTPQLYLKGKTPYFSDTWVSRDTWHKIKFVCNNGEYEYFVDGVSKDTQTYTTSDNTFQFRTSSGAELTFKNFCIYPI